MKHTQRPNLLKAFTFDLDTLQKYNELQTIDGWNASFTVREAIRAAYAKEFPTDV